MPFPISGYAIAPDSRTLVFLTSEPAGTANVSVIYSIQDDGKRLTRILSGQPPSEEGGPGSMVAVCEGFLLAERLGLDAQKLFDISSKSSGQCWSLTNYCPVPGPVPAAPSNREYKPGFTADMMLKDMRLSQQAAASAGAATTIGAAAAAAYERLVEAGGGPLDFSAMMPFLKGTLKEIG